MDGRHRVLEIPLREELLSSFCKRGRRRLREIQSACGVELRLDRASGILVASGPPSCLAALQRYLAGLVGHRRVVPLPVWAELMRTRTLTEGDDATMQRLQEQCGCRVHIERSLIEVRVFGEDDGARKADELLASLEQSVVEEAVAISPRPPAARPSAAALQRLADRCRVTVRLEQAEVSVYGLKERVVDAAAEVRQYLEDPRRFEAALNAEPGSFSPALAQDQASPPDASPSWLFGTGSSPPAAARAATPGGGSAVQPAGAKGGSAAGTVHGPAAVAAPVGQDQHAVCPTCGCGRFCVHCGTPVWTMVPMGMSPYPQFPGSSTSTTARTYSEDLIPGTPPDEGGPQCWASGGGGGGGGFAADSGQGQGHQQQGLAMMTPGGLVPVCLVPAFMPGGHEADAGSQQMCMMPVNEEGGYGTPFYVQGPPMPQWQRQPHAAFEATN